MFINAKKKNNYNNKQEEEGNQTTESRITKTFLYKREREPNRYIYRLIITRNRDGISDEPKGGIVGHMMGSLIFRQIQFLQRKLILQKNQHVCILTI